MKLKNVFIQIILILGFCLVHPFSFAMKRRCNTSAVDHILKNELGPFEDQSYKTIRHRYLWFLQNSFRLEKTYRLLGGSENVVSMNGQLKEIQNALFAPKGSSDTLRVLETEGQSRLVEVKDIKTIKDVVDLLKVVVKIQRDVVELQEDEARSHQLASETFEIVAYATSNKSVRYFIRLSSYRYLDDFGFPKLQEIPTVLKMTNSKSENLYFMGTLGRTHAQGFSFPSSKEIKNQRDSYRVKHRFSVILSPDSDYINFFDAQSGWLVNEKIMEQGIGSLWDRAVGIKSSTNILKN